MRRVKSPRRRDAALASAVKPSENPIKVFLQYSALPLTLGTALLYLLGWIYGTKYLDAWGIPEALFPLTKNQSLIIGFFHILLLFANSMSFVAKAMVLLLVGMIATMICCYKPIYTWLTHSVPMISEPLKRRVVITSTHDSMMNKIAFLAGGIVWSVLVAFLVALLCGWVDKQAKERAAKERTAIVTGVTDRPNFPAKARCYVSKDAKTFTIYSGHLIENSTTHAALYTRNKGMVILPMSQVAHIEIRDRTLAAK